MQSHGSRQHETLDPGFLLLGTRQQDVPIILRELVLPDGFDPVSPSFTDVTLTEFRTKFWNTLDIGSEPYKIADIQWQHHVGNAEVRHRVFRHRDDNAIGVTILKHRLRWLGHVLRTSSQRTPRRALFADSGTGWEKRRGVQCMTWCRVNTISQAYFTVCQLDLATMWQFYGYPNMATVLMQCIINADCLEPCPYSDTVLANAFANIIKEFNFMGSIETALKLSKICRSILCRFPNQSPLLQASMEVELEQHLRSGYDLAQCDRLVNSIKLYCPWEAAIR
ncbi:unnamed protein product [Schistosoma curassoni]|uniref:Cyclin_C domain-containing protein n=1 Tax=Schistosoma curassoni TaxID=6186 RepID=A0A183KLP6_9TREM|nr:unnamed protein product [Schistosoma curassoni]